MCRIKHLNFPHHKSGSVIVSVSHSRNARAFVKMRDKKNGTILKPVTFQFHGASPLCFHVTFRPKLQKEWRGRFGKEAVRMKKKINK